MRRNGDGLVMIDGAFNYKWQYLTQKAKTFGKDASGWKKMKKNDDAAS